MLFYSRNCPQQNWAQFVLSINSDCMYIAYFWLQLWPQNSCKNIGYYSIFQLSLLQLLNNFQYNCNNTISSVSVAVQYCIPLHKIKQLLAWEYGVLSVLYSNIELGSASFNIVVSDPCNSIFTSTQVSQ